MLTDLLVTRGFKVLDEGVLTQASEREVLKMLRDGREKAADVSVLQLKTDITLLGDVQVKSTEKEIPYLGKQTFCEGMANRRAVFMDTAEIITTGVVSKSNRVVVLESEDRTRTLDAIIKEWLNNKRLGLLVAAVVDPCQVFTLELTGCSHANVTALDEKLNRLRFVRKTEVPAFDIGLARLHVQYFGQIKSLANEIEAATFAGGRILIESITRNKIRAHWQSKK
jgi:hypothetical protein